MNTFKRLATALAVSIPLVSCQYSDAKLAQLSDWEVPNDDEMDEIFEAFAHNQRVADLMIEAFIPLADDEKLASIHNEPGSRYEFVEGIHIAEGEFVDTLQSGSVYLFDPAVWGNKYSGAYEEFGIAFNPNYDLRHRDMNHMLFTHEAAHRYGSHPAEFVSYGHNTTEQNRDYNLLTTIAINYHDFAAQISMLGRDAGPLIEQYYYAMQSLDRDIELWRSNPAVSSDIINYYLQHGPKGLWPQTLRYTFVDNFNPDNFTFDEFGIDNLHLHEMLKASDVLQSLREKYIAALRSALLRD